MTRFIILSAGAILAAALISGCTSTGANTITPKPNTIAGVSIADAGGKFFSRKVHLAADTETVFSYMTDFSAIPEWFSVGSVNVDHSASESGPEVFGIGTVRSLKSYGLTIIERVVASDPPNSFAVSSIGTSAFAPLKTRTEIVEISPGETGSDLTYSVIYDTKSLHPMSPFVSATLEGQMEKGLDNLVDRFGGYRYEE